MSHEHVNPEERDTVVIVGGKGGLAARYREAVERNGYRCRYYEDRLPSSSSPSRTKIALVIILVTMISHPLMSQARELADSSARIIYLRSPSVSSVRQSVEAVTQQRAKQTA